MEKPSADPTKDLSVNSYDMRFSSGVRLRTTNGENDERVPHGADEPSNEFADDDRPAKKSSAFGITNKAAAVAAVVLLLTISMSIVTYIFGPKRTIAVALGKRKHTRMVDGVRVIDRRTLRQRIIDDGDPDSSLCSDDYFTPDDSPDCRRSPLERKRVDVEMACDEVDAILEMERTELGTGFWREVSLVNYKGRDLAVKVLKKTQKQSRRNKERHRWEAVALQSVAGHPNVVGVVGVCDCDVVTEYYPLYLDVILLTEEGKKEYNFTTRQILQMALEAGRGLEALHVVPGGPIVHSDLQPRQILLSEDFVVKVNDLNRLRFMGTDEAGDPCPFRIGTSNGIWRAPEEYADELLSEKLDVYSMGMIYWAMLGREKPFDRSGNYKQQVLRGDRPFVDPSWHKGFVELFQDMWQDDPERRPSMTEVVARLETMLNELPED